LKPAGEIEVAGPTDGRALDTGRPVDLRGPAAVSRPLHISLILNSNAGTLRGYDPEQVADELAGIFREHGHSVAPEVYAGRSAVAAIARICRGGGSDAIVVGGGDGTISAAAATAAEGRLPLGVIPLGTMNLFARALGIPLEMRAAARSLASGSISSVDVGEVNGRFFIHHVTLGLHPRMIRIRERLHYGSRMGKIFASAHAFWIVLRQPPRLQATLNVDGERLQRRTAAILVSNNPLGEGHLPYADDLRQGKLGLYAATSRRWGDLLQLTAQVTLGQISQNPLLESWQAEHIEISFSRPVVNAALDGEIVSLRSPLRLGVRERGLQVLKPAAPSA
jgi:diacylglycerol kinase family enzyme